MTIRLRCIGCEYQLIPGVRLHQIQIDAGAPRNGMIGAGRVTGEANSADNRILLVKRKTAAKGLTPYEFICKCWTSEPIHNQSAPANAGTKHLAPNGDNFCN